MTTPSQSCPYKALPASSYWRNSVANVPAAALDPVIQTKFQISKADKIATAGSCFAQHIARYLAKSDFQYYVAEPGHVLVSPDCKAAYNYGTFSGRYGNIYTARQLLQLIQRAVGTFNPDEAVWTEQDRYVDPFRPHIQPNGFPTMTELLADRQVHLRAVRSMMQTMDVFVFTLGLTETWQSRTDGAVFPVCPGCGAGIFDSSRYEFVNLSVEQVVADLQESLRLLREFNPALRVILTVSPVPLIATYRQDHVLQATTYSKAVLRVAADMVARNDTATDYFPSFEIITGAYSRGAYYAADLREVVEDGVQHVMQVFLRHFAGLEISRQVKSTGPATPPGASLTSSLAATIVCDEEHLNR